MVGLLFCCIFVETINKIMNNYRTKVTGVVKLKEPYNTLRYKDAYSKLVGNIDRVPIEVIEKLIEDYV